MTNAKRRAVHDILFTGIKSGAGSRSIQYPLVAEVNAYERYADYFEPFFSPGGEWTNFVKEADTKSTIREAKGEAREGNGVVVTVDVSALRRQLKADGVIK